MSALCWLDRRCRCRLRYFTYHNHDEIVLTGHFAATENAKYDVEPTGVPVAPIPMEL